MNPKPPDPSRLSSRLPPPGSHLGGPIALGSVLSLHLEDNHSYSSQLRLSQNINFLTVLFGFVSPVTQTFRPTACHFVCVCMGLHRPLQDSQQQELEKCLLVDNSSQNHLYIPQGLHTTPLARDPCQLPQPPYSRYHPCLALKVTQSRLATLRPLEPFPAADPHPEPSSQCQPADRRVRTPGWKFLRASPPLPDTR